MNTDDDFTQFELTARGYDIIKKLKLTYDDLNQELHAARRVDLKNNIQNFEEVILNIHADLGGHDKENQKILTNYLIEIWNSRRSNLLLKFNAVSDEYNRKTSDADRIQLSDQQKSIEIDINEIEAKLTKYGQQLLKSDDAYSGSIWVSIVILGLIALAAIGNPNTSNLITKFFSLTPAPKIIFETPIKEAEQSPPETSSIITETFNIPALLPGVYKIDGTDCQTSPFAQMKPLTLKDSRNGAYCLVFDEGRYDGSVLGTWQDKKILYMWYGLTGGSFAIDDNDPNHECFEWWFGDSGNDIEKLMHINEIWVFNDHTAADINCYRPQFSS